MKLPERSTYEDLVRDFHWGIPPGFNIGRVIADDWAAIDPARVCLAHFSLDGNHQQLTYGALASRSSQLAHGLGKLGIKRGDRVALLLPQGFDIVIAHAAIYKLGAIALPLALLFGADALSWRLMDAGAIALITNQFGASKLEGVQLDELKHVIVTDGDTAGAINFAGLMDGQPVMFNCADTGPDDPAMMIYTSGTTGPPKGVLHGHRVLAGHIPGIRMAHEFFPQPGDRFWTPSDWAWAGGLLNCLLPSLMLGVPVVASPSQKFDPRLAFKLMAEMDIRNAFIPPTALRLMRGVENPRQRYDLKLRSIGSAGEALGRETYEWAKGALGLTINEFYGQTECNFVLGSMASLGVSRAGAIGKPVPGHQVFIVDDNGQPVEPGTVGQIAVKRPDPVMFLGYWNNPQATADKFIGDLMLTGDQGMCDPDGYVSFFGRDDDIITSSGYRIGPSEIEDCLIAHPAVRLAAVIGKPDSMRTEIVKAYIVLEDGFLDSEQLKTEIAAWVKTRLSMHEYPREIEFIGKLPMTTTGKIIRRFLRQKSIDEITAATAT